MCDMSDICMTLIILISDLLPENFSSLPLFSHRKEICQHCLFLRSSSFYFILFYFILFYFLFSFFFSFPLHPWMIPQRVLPNRASPLSLNHSQFSRSRLVRPGSSSPSPAAFFFSCLVLAKTSSGFKKRAPKNIPPCSPRMDPPKTINGSASLLTVTGFNPRHTNRSFSGTCLGVRSQFGRQDRSRSSYDSSVRLLAKRMVILHGSSARPSFFAED
ncbi:uncharacterized protein BO96DRAFT_141917 [Aspergillus niger CBS 101883]|uniref:uncharacterized protein n=1 Tax=Aspergillus lacticoffeatus (strain CBS 101883) TaxID=1450533 RepID=UPI000D802CD0|nr:uncharacterized protein BO96DRAFT_141917 [Aspergillus niger CBS 101883]PYH60527.1 hypothetical protein BO96DRAFT_141917 [Aspergillus niger CBS 101883]